jgi:hypothetical protein
MPTTLLSPYPLPYPAASARFLCESWWTCYSTAGHTWRNRSDSLLATGLPLSVISPTIRDALDLEVTPAPGWGGQIPTWFGIVCRIGRVTVWLPVQENPGYYQAFSLLALLPTQELADAPPFIHLGAQFLLEYRVRVSIDGSSGSMGHLLFP